MHLQDDIVEYISVGVVICLSDVSRETSLVFLLKNKILVFSVSRETFCWALKTTHF